jgi:hypothetical protein
MLCGVLGARQEGAAMANYQFYLDSCEIMDTRSFHEDTIVAGLGCIVNQTVHNSTLAAQVGDHNNGKFTFWQQGLGSLDQVEIGDDDQFVFIYQLYNNGQAGRPSVADVQAYIDRDLLGGVNKLLAMASSAGDLNQVEAQIAQAQAQIQQLNGEIAAAKAKEAGGVANKMAGMKRFRTVAPQPINAPSLGNQVAGQMMREDSLDALNQQLQALQRQETDLTAELAKIKQAGSSFSVLMPGADWRADGPFTSGDYSEQNYAHGQLISIVGNIILAGCDGPLAFGFVAGTGAQLDQRIPAVGPLTLSGEFKGKDLGWSAPCNPSGSHYVVNTIIQRQ